MSIYKFIRSIFSNDLYVQIWENRVKITNIDSKQVFDEEPLVAIKKNKKGQSIIEDIGDSVKALINKHEYKIINPFSHPRLLVNDFEVAEKILQHAFRELHKDKFIAPSPRVIFQPMEKLEGGITGIENRVYSELCLGAGAREVYIHTGSELSLYGFDFEQLKKNS
jgi:rod shape-determining protein MreB